MSARMHSYLDSIAAKKPVVLKGFYQQLSLLGIDADWARVHLDATRQKGDYYFITLDVELREAIAQRLISPNATRVEASRKNRSHAVKVDGSMLLVRRGRRHPEVVLFDKDGLHSQFEQQNSALIIENRQNFISIDAMAAFLADKCRLELNDGIDVIFAAGNEVNNRLHTSFLQQYQKLYLMLDLDEGGLRIANNLIKRCPLSEYYFLLPDDIELRLQQVPNKASIQTLESIHKLASSSPVLAHTASLVLKYGKILEQESYLEA